MGINIERARSLPAGLHGLDRLTGYSGVNWQLERSKDDGPYVVVI
jgi:hypothetical protein